MVCNMHLPRTNYHLQKDNPVEQLFWGKLPLVRATSYFFYRKGSDYRFILHRLKYGGRKEIGKTMGEYMAAELMPSGFFEDVDLIVPVPLHKKRQSARGYNQSEWIARGITAVTGIPTDCEVVVRRKNSETQTRKSVFERWENVEGIFELSASSGYSLRASLAPPPSLFGFASEPLWPCLRASLALSPSLFVLCGK